jgi:hypothetical protein
MQGVAREVGRRREHKERHFLVSLGARVLFFFRHCKNLQGVTESGGQAAVIKGGVAPMFIQPGGGVLQALSETTRE